MLYEYKFLISLSLTLAIEVPVLFLLARLLLKISSSKVSGALLLFAGLIASFSTLPYLWFIFPTLFNNIRSWYIVSAELFAFMTESIIYYFILRISLKKATLLSLFCNLTSFLLGVVFFYLLRGFFA